VAAIPAVGACRKAAICEKGKVLDHCGGFDRSDELQVTAAL
jgi:hypothetical protein